MRQKYFYSFIFFLFFSSISLNVNAQFVANENSFQGKVSLHKYAKIVNVGQKQYTVEELIKDKDLQFKSLPTENTDLGFTCDNYWVTFQITNATTSDIVPFLEASRPIVDVANLYVIRKNKNPELFKSGDIIPFKDRTLDTRKIIFKIPIQPKETVTFYLHLKSDGEVINVPLYLKSAVTEIQESAQEQFIFGFFYGILVIAAILYLFFFVAMKERVFLYYSLYVLFIGLLQFSVDGYFYKFIAPNNIWLSSHSVLIFATLANILLGKYSETFLKVKRHSTFLLNFYYVLYALNLLTLLLIVVIPDHQYFYPIANVLGLYLLLLVISSFVFVSKKTKTVDKFYGVGILFLILGFVVFILKNFSILPSVFWTENSSKIGTGLEVIFLSLSMASLIKKLKEDREVLQGIALQKSEEMNELKSYFLSNISHELRTPLNTIMNLIDLINGETDSNSIQKKCEIIRYSSQNLLSSVNDILDFSKIEKDEIKLENNEFDSHKLFMEINNHFESRAKEKGLDFQFTMSNLVPKTLSGDVERLRQILTNILYNALKFTSEGSIKFKIDVELVNDNSVNLIFLISDTGNGIPKDKLSSIFDSFSQESSNNKRKYGGLGLGLYIVNALVKLHGGKINIDSIVNQGSVCNLTLPLIKVIEKEIVLPTLINDYDLKGKRILVVEDNAMNQMVIKMITKKWLNTTIDYVFNGQEAIDNLNSIKYDIILMDLQMPIMDGYEATLGIRSGNCGINDRNIPIIAVTADVMESTKDRVKEIGMNFYISKPVNKELLFDTILKIA